jgi:hypothetical protein
MALHRSMGRFFTLTDDLDLYVALIWRPGAILIFPASM